MVIGVAPIAIAIGATISTSPVPTLAGWAGGPLIVGGAAQLLTIQMLADRERAVRDRRVGAARQRPGGRLRRRDRTLVPRGVAAPAAARGDPVDRPALLHRDRALRARRPRPVRTRLAYYVGAGGLLLASWMALQAVAIAAGSTLPDWVGLHLAAPLALGGLLAKVATGRPATAAAVIAAGVSRWRRWRCRCRPGASVGVVAGIAAGVLVTRRAARTAGRDRRGRADDRLARRHRDRADRLRAAGPDPRDRRDPTTVRTASWCRCASWDRPRWRH